MELLTEDVLSHILTSSLGGEENVKRVLKCLLVCKTWLRVLEKSDSAWNNICAVQCPAWYCMKGTVPKMHYLRAYNLCINQPFLPRLRCAVPGNEGVLHPFLETSVPEYVIQAEIIDKDGFRQTILVNLESFTCFPKKTVFFPRSGAFKRFVLCSEKHVRCLDFCQETSNTVRVSMGDKNHIHIILFHEPSDGQRRASFYFVWKKKSEIFQEEDDSWKAAMKSVQEFMHSREEVA